VDFRKLNKKYIIVLSKKDIMNSGYLELIIGPMFSGKTTRLIDIYYKTIDDNKVAFTINYSGDTRYHDSMLSSHDKRMIPCTFTSTLTSLWNSNIVENIHNADVILINEGQFFPDLYEVVLALVEQYGKIVYVCGLDGDFKRQPFGQLMQLIPLCNNILKLHSKCSMCNKDALFSHRTSNETTQIVIGSSNYKPLCRGCYLDSNK
jgi:thymidine kinase